MLFVALSAFQGRPQQDALNALLRHDPDGIQLTPGNLPTAGFEAAIDGERARRAIRQHHGFAWDAYRRSVYGHDGRPIQIGRDHSVHPPRSSPDKRALWTCSTDDFLPIAAAHDLLIETMYPGYAVGCGRDVEKAMDAGLRLAVDVSHIAIQRHHGVLTESTLRRLMAYDRVEEVHVSKSVRGRDVHRPIDRDTFGLDWARERLTCCPVVLESYWHRSSFDEQCRQLDLLRR